MKKLLQLHNLSVGYKNTVLINAINASINEGEFVVVLGKNGVGKSTLINSILGFEKFLDGEIYIENSLIKTLSTKSIAQKIAVVLPKLVNVPKIKVFDLVVTARLPYSKTLKNLSIQESNQINDLFKLVGIDNLKDKYANELSEGQLQLVMILRAFCQDTSLIILDEPTSNLDLENQLKIFKLLKDLKAKTNKSFLMITHEVDLALQFADKVWWIENQHLKQGLPEEIAFQYQIISKLSGNHLVYHPALKNYSNIELNQNKIKVVGDSELSFWVRKGLERIGYTLSDSDVKVIEVTEKNIIFEHENFESIDSFLNYIQHEKHYHNRSE